MSGRSSLQHIPPTAILDEWSKINIFHRQRNFHHSLQTINTNNIIYIFSVNDKLSHRQFPRRSTPSHYTILVNSSVTWNVNSYHYNFTDGNEEHNDISSSWGNEWCLWGNKTPSQVSWLLPNQHIMIRTLGRK